MVQSTGDTISLGRIGEAEKQAELLRMQVQGDNADDDDEEEEDE